MAHATLAVAAGSRAVGFAATYPGGHVVMGEFTDRYEAVCHVEALLQNGFAWTVRYGSIGTVGGALWYVSMKHGATFVLVDPAEVTDAALRKAGLWRRGMAAANAAARLLIKEND